MKYIDKFSDMRPEDNDRENIICARSFALCCVCGHPTCYIEINYEGYFCSEECLQKFEQKLTF